MNIISHVLMLGISLSVAAANAKEAVASDDAMQSKPNCCAVLELRQYTLKLGQRDTLIGLFDSKFVEGQENVGMTIVGQFRDLDAPDRFVWFRGFGDMPQRKRALESFYGGPVWQTNRTAANNTMIDSDNVLLLRPATVSSGFELQGLSRDQRPAGLVVVALHYLRQPADPSMLQQFERQLRSALEKPNAQLHALLVSEHSQNTFSALPVRLGEEVLVWVVGFDNPSAYEAQRAALEDIASQLKSLESRPGERLRLEATTASLLRGARKATP